MTDSTFLPSDDTEADTVLTITYPQNGGEIRGAVLAVTGAMQPTGWLLPVSIHEWVDEQWRYIGASAPFIGPLWGAICVTTSGRKTIIARVIGSTSLESAPVTFDYIFEALLNIISPIENSTVGPVGELVVTGSGKTGETVFLFTSDEKLALGSAVVGDDHLWRVVVDQNLLPHGGEIKIMAATDMAHWTPVRTFNLIPIASPVITQPTANAPTDVRGPVSGTGHPGSEISVLRDLQHSFVVGCGTVSENKQWSITQWVNDMPPGPFGIIARQSFEGRVIDSAARHFNVRPPALTKVDIDFPTSTTIGFSGSGHVGATVEIRFVSPPDGVVAPPPVPVDANGKWRATGSNWPSGDYSLTAIQKVSNNAGGWIESTPFAFSVKKGLPDVTHTQDYQPTFSGKGVSGAKVFVAIPGGAPAAPEIPVNAAGNWETKASEIWGPSNRPVHIVQTKDGLSSEWHEYQVGVINMSDEFDEPVIQNWAAPVFTVPLAGTVKTLPLSVTCASNVGRSGTWTVRLYNPDFVREFTGSYPGYNYSFTVDNLVLGRQCEIQTKFRAQGVDSSWAYSGKFHLLGPVTVDTPPALVGPNPVITGKDAYPGATVVIKEEPIGASWQSLADGSGNWSVVMTGARQITYRLTAIHIFDLAIVSSPEFSLTVARAPNISSPVSDTTLYERRPVVSGKGQSGTEINIFEARHGGVLYGTGTVGSNSEWQIKLTTDLPEREIVLVAECRHLNQHFYWSNEVRVTVVIIPLGIESPTPGEFMAPPVTIRGTGTPGLRIDVMNPEGTIHLGNAQVQSDGSWAAPFNHNNYPNGGEVPIVAGYANIDEWTPPRTFYVATAPAITLPTGLDPVDVRGRISGTGLPGSEITVLKDLQHSFVVGRGTVGADKQWSVTQWVNDMPPGPFAIIARLTVEGKNFDSAARPFNVRPPALTKVEVDLSTSNTIGFSGRGYYDAGIKTEVEIRFKVPAQVNLPPRVQVDANGHWQTTATGWPPGDYSLIAVQMVEDRAGGWIESTAYEFVVKKGLPDVTDVEHTQDYQPTFSGRGVSGALVYVVKNGGALEAPETLVGPSGSWTTQALHVWGPTQDRPVYIQQRKDGLTSKDWFEYKVSIAPLPPEIDTPPAIGLTPEFSGTCWGNSRLTLTFSGSTTEHTVNGVNGIWKYRRPEPFTSGVSYTISAKQTAAGETSVTKTLPFTVRRPMSTPQITAPAEDAVVGHQITVRGSDGMAGATLQLRHASNKQPLGEAKVLSSDGVWEIALSDLDFERYDFYSIEAFQTLGPDTSPVSDRRGFTVAVLPPVIEVPASGESLARTSIISGKCRPFATVELEIGGQRFRNIPVSSEGFWEIEPTLPVGSKTLNARVLFNATLSEEMSVQYTVVPAPPFIETPAPGEHVGRRAVVSGFGIPGDSVAVRLGNAQGRVLGESPVLPDRTWSVALASDQTGGRFGVVAVASCDGFSSADSEARTVNLGTYAPTVEQPASGRWVVNPVRFNGKGRPGSATLVSWFNPDQVWASALPVNGSGWQGEANAPLAPGGQWVRLQQTISGGADGETHSDWVDSGRFEVQPPEPEG